MEAPGSSTTNEITLEIMRVCIALSVFSVGVELPKKYVWRHWRSIIMLLGPVMLWGWLITGLLIWALIPGIDYLSALMIASCVSPTDPILAQAVVGGPWAEKHVPAHIRHMLQCESGCNDGAAFPFLFLAYFLTVNRGEVGFPVAKFFYQTIAWEIVFGTFLGGLVGFLARKFIRFSEKHKLVDRESFVAQYLSLAIAVMGLTVLLGSDDLLAAFACGTAFAWDGWFQKQTADSNFSSIVDLIFNVATFIYIGAEMPWREFNDSAMNLSVGRLIGLSILVLILKRIPIVILCWKFIPDIKTFHEAIFTGYFGPMGVGAIFMCTYGRRMLPENVNIPPQTPNEVLSLTIQPIVFFFVLASVIVHGFTIPFFAFGKRAQVNLNRTLSIYPSTFPNSEPSWVHRIRRFNTNATAASAEPDQVPSSVVQAMQEGYERHKASGNVEPEENPDENMPKSKPFTKPEKSVGFGRVQTIDDVDDANVSEGDDWEGEDTVEMRRHRMRLEDEKRKEMFEGQDITDVPRNTDNHDLEKQAVMFSDDENNQEYPKMREWVEGNNLLVEVTERPLDEPETVVVPLTEEMREDLELKENPLRSALMMYEDKLAKHIGWEGKSKLFDLPLSQLRQHRVLSKLSEFTSHIRKERNNSVTGSRDLGSSSSIQQQQHPNSIRPNNHDSSSELEVVAVKPNGTILQ